MRLLQPSATLCAAVVVVVSYLCFAVAAVEAMAVKKILVTGGNKGIGRAICQRLVTEWKDTVVYLGSRDQERGSAAIQEILKEAPDCSKDRLQLVVVDTSSDASIKEAAAKLEGTELYGIINNAGIGWGYTMQETINTNYFGPRRVNEAFGKFLQRPGGRIVNVASASGPNYVSGLPDSNPLKSLLGKPWTIPGGIGEVDEMARSMKAGNDGYGASKSLLNAYTYLHAKIEKDLIINSVTPGFIATDLTAGTSATNPTSKGAVPPCFLMMDEDVAKKPTGRYYGSDCVRSPISFYRGPGEPPYESDEDLVELPESASKMATVL